MQPLDDATKVPADDLECASLVVDTVLLGMGVIRAEVRRSRPSELSVPQFRVLAYLNRHEGASLSDVAEHIGLTLPSMSKAIDGLVKLGYVERAASADDRRRVMLSFTGEGLDTFRTTSEAVRVRVAELLAGLSQDERADLVRVMDVLRSALPSNRRNFLCK